MRPLVCITLLIGCATPAAPSDASIDAPDAIAIDAAPTPITCPGPFAAPNDAELATRHALGIPDEAGCVVVISQTSHMDVDWRVSFDAYYAMYVEAILTSAHDLLAADSAYRYQVAEMAFLAHHLAAHPEQVAGFHDAAMRGALSVVGGGITSPDTLLPTTEPLVRDFLRGSLVAESIGARVHAAWLPDSFGHSPTTPDLLAALGFDAVAFARVDGLHDATEHAHGQATIVTGSTADTLTQMHASDFVWRGPSGAEVLAHWLPVRLYCEGDNIDHTGLPVPGGFVFGDDRSGDSSYVDAQIGSFVAELTPYARTPYLFVPVGCDFALPHEHLADHVRRWNAERYPSTGVYLVFESFASYGDLLAERHGDLPTLSPDMSDYFSGYFASRLALKQAIRAAGDALVQAEIAALFAERFAGAPDASSAIESAWDLFARTDHHDFVSGTAADDVVTSEQMPLAMQTAGLAQTTIDAATQAIGAAAAPEPSAATTLVVVGTAGAASSAHTIAHVVLAAGTAHDLAASAPSQILASTRHPDGSIATADVLVALPSLAPATAIAVPLFDRAATGPISVTDDGTTIMLVDSDRDVHVAIDRATGAMTHFVVAGHDALDAPSLTIERWRDEGGLYRIGSETTGCHFDDLGAIDGAITVTVLETGPARARVIIARGAASIELSLVAGTGRLDLAVDASAALGEALTLVVHTSTHDAHAFFTHAGGSIERPSTSLYAPSFWPVVRALDLRSDAGAGIALLPRFSTGVAWAADGTMSVLISRDAMSERCDVLGQGGTEVVHASLALSLMPHASSIDPLAEAMALVPAPAAIASGVHALPSSLIDLGGEGWVLSAMAHAVRGGGIVMRVERTRSDAMLTWPAGTDVSRTDAMERTDAAVASPLALDAPLVTLRL